MAAAAARTHGTGISRAGSDYDIADSGGLVLHVEVRPIDTAGIAGIPAGTRSVSIFLVNRRAPDEDNPDLAYAFQAEIEVEGEHTFVPRPDLRGAQAEDWDEQVADLHYADAPELATGHGVSADWDIVDGACRRLRTAWIPSASVEKTETRDGPAVELSMETLGALDDGAAAEVALRPLVDEYRAWVEGRREEMTTLQGERRDTAEGLLLRAAHAADRIEHGIALLESDEDSLDAFRVANRAVASALRQRLGAQFDDRHPPRWRAFQLAFILLNLPGLSDPLDPHRETVDLLFFPTGGGKTEAYLGLAAFTMVLRRLRNPGRNGVQGARVSIIMRYTLRLLTLDQLARASGLVCALELEREADAVRYGDWPFEIGLWVGKAVTPNLMGHKKEMRSDSARERLEDMQQDHMAWMQTRKVQRPFPGGPYVLLHTLSHLLIRSLAMRCGYPASSIRERVYVEDGGEGTRYGILLYTGTPDAEGTLGGLVQQARDIEDHLADALRTGALCSNDPICAQHAPGTSMEGRWLHGSACHGCALIAETSCEMRNDYLDRALVVPVLGLDGAAFFQAPS